jgi:hydroxymethylbilane synthase
MSSAIKLGTRSSALALSQSGHVAASLRELGHEVVIVPMLSPGDLNTIPLSGLGQEGIFVSSVREALLNSEIDIAVHSFKDVPTNPAQGIWLGAVPLRVDPRDTLVSRWKSLSDLPIGARVGTCSVRREAWVSRNRSDLQVVAIRGDINKRIAAMHSGEYDAIILAAAGLLRNDLTSEISQFIEIRDLVPAPAQGALAVECRNSDAKIKQFLTQINHFESLNAALLERRIFSRIDENDNTAFGVLAEFATDWIRVVADISNPDGSNRLLLEETEHFANTYETQAAMQTLEEKIVAQLKSHQTSLGNVI